MPFGLSTKSKTSSGRRLVEVYSEDAKYSVPVQFEINAIVIRPSWFVNAFLAIDVMSHSYHVAPPVATRVIDAEAVVEHC